MACQARRAGVFSPMVQLMRCEMIRNSWKWNCLFFFGWVVGTILCTPSSSQAARNFPIVGTNELCGGFGFQASLADATPGGFKWFNDYSHQLSQLTWLNVQLNVVLGGSSGWDCYSRNGKTYCDHWRRWSGNALEMAVGAKLKWRARKIPLQIHAKFGGAVVGLFLA